MGCCPKVKKNPPAPGQRKLGRPAVAPVAQRPNQPTPARKPAADASKSRGAQQKPKGKAPAASVNKSAPKTAPRGKSGPSKSGKEKTKGSSKGSSKGSAKGKTDKNQSPAQKTAAAAAATKKKSSEKSARSAKSKSSKSNSKREAPKEASNSKKQQKGSDSSKKVATAQSRTEKLKRKRNPQKSRIPPPGSTTDSSLIPPEEPVIEPSKPAKDEKAPPPPQFHYASLADPSHPQQQLVVASFVTNGRRVKRWTYADSYPAGTKAPSLGAILAERPSWPQIYSPKTECPMVVIEPVGKSGNQVTRALSLTSLPPPSPNVARPSGDLNNCKSLSYSASKSQERVEVQDGRRGAAASSSRRQKQHSREDKQPTIDDALVEETLRRLDDLAKQVESMTRQLRTAHKK
ncbi:unnamed protein product, partial [Mesorhabditis spiculigera]